MLKLELDAVIEIYLLSFHVNPALPLNTLVKLPKPICVLAKVPPDMVVQVGFADDP